MAGEEPRVATETVGEREREGEGELDEMRQLCDRLRREVAETRVVRDYLVEQYGHALFRARAAEAELEMVRRQVLPQLQKARDQLSDQAATIERREARIEELATEDGRLKHALEHHSGMHWTDAVAQVVGMHKIRENSTKRRVDKPEKA